MAVGAGGSKDGVGDFNDSGYLVIESTCGHALVEIKSDHVTGTGALELGTP